jgi:glycosyltransferase involved in cell wall biosynthesis
VAWTELAFDAVREADPRTWIVVNPAKFGTAAAVNRGIDNASADIFVRLDADDLAPAMVILRSLRAGGRARKARKAFVQPLAQFHFD